MAHAYTSSSAPSNQTDTTNADANAYHYAQHYGRAVMKLRTEEADMEVEDSETYQAIIKEPFDGSFSERMMDMIEDSEYDGDQFAVKLLWWHARVVMGKFLPGEIMDMVVKALRVGSRCDEDDDEDFYQSCWSDRGAGGKGSGRTVYAVKAAA